MFSCIYSGCFETKKICLRLISACEDHFIVKSDRLLELMGPKCEISEYFLRRRTKITNNSFRESLPVALKTVHRSDSKSRF